MNLKLHYATTRDIAQLSDIGRISYRHHFTHLWDSEDALAQYLEHEFSHEAIQVGLRHALIDWFLISTTEVIGLAKLSYQQNIPQHDLTGTLINKIYLLPQHTGQGHGDLIFKKIEQLALEYGDDYLWLEVLDSNPQARRFYEKSGMQLIGSTAFQSGSQQSQLDIMGKTL